MKMLELEDYELPTVPRGGDPDSVATVVAGGSGILVVILIILVLQAVYYRAEESEILRKRYLKPAQELTELRAAQEEQLHTYRWVDKEKQVVTIPIEKAMEIVADELGDGRSKGTPGRGASPSGAE